MGNRTDGDTVTEAVKNIKLTREEKKVIKQEERSWNKMIRRLTKKDAIIIDNPTPTTTCPDCGGEGRVFYSCCTGQPTEYDHCQKCGEPLGEEDCETCGGTGKVEECDDCSGTGEREVTKYVGEEGMRIEMDVFVICATCRGIGVVPATDADQSLVNI